MNDGEQPSVPSALAPDSQTPEGGEADAQSQGAGPIIEDPGFSSAVVEHFGDIFDAPLPRLAAFRVGYRGGVYASPMPRADYDAGVAARATWDREMRALTVVADGR